MGHVDRCLDQKTGASASLQLRIDQESEGEDVEEEPSTTEGSKCKQKSADIQENALAVHIARPDYVT